MDAAVTLGGGDLHIPWHPRVLLDGLFASDYCGLTQW